MGLQIEAALGITHWGSFEDYESGLRLRLLCFGYKEQFNLMKLWMLTFLASYEKFLRCAWNDWEYSLVQVFAVAFGWLWVIMDNFDR